MNEAVTDAALKMPAARRPRASAPKTGASSRCLGLYRLLLVTTLLTLHRSGFAPEFFGLLKPTTFFYGCLTYALLALVLLLLGAFRRPQVRVQAHLHAWRSTC